MHGEVWCITCNSQAIRPSLFSSVVKREIFTHSVYTGEHENRFCKRIRPHIDYPSPRKPHAGSRFSQTMSTRASAPMLSATRAITMPSTINAAPWMLPFSEAVGRGQSSLRLYSTARSTESSLAGIEVRTNRPDAASAYDVVIHPTDIVSGNQAPCLPRIWLRCVLT